MARGFSLNFDGFLDLAEDISNLSNEVLAKAAVSAVEESRKSVNIAIGKAMRESKYNFEAGQGYSQGTARESLIEISQKPTEVNGTVIEAVAGVDLSKAPEVIILASGTPHLAKDTKLYNAIKVKGKVRKQIDEIQKNIFNAALEEALSNG